jgi:hypothetical protein
MLHLILGGAALSALRQEHYFESGFSRCGQSLVQGTSFSATTSVVPQEPENDLGFSP